MSDPTVEVLTTLRAMVKREILLTAHETQIRTLRRTAALILGPSTNLRDAATCRDIAQEINATADVLESMGPEGDQ